MPSKIFLWKTHWLHQMFWKYSRICGTQNSISRNFVKLALFHIFYDHRVITLCHISCKNLLGNFLGVQSWLSYKLEHIERQKWRGESNLAGLRATKNIGKHRDWIDCLKLVSPNNGSAGTQLEWRRIFRKKDFSMTVFDKEIGE